MVLQTLADQLNISPQILGILIIWSLIWKGLALWKSAKSNQPAWFVIMLVINTIGILEIIYLMLYSNHSIKPSPNSIKSNKRKISRRKKH
ncbi:MAG: DUF5652 family protein [Nanoarchaeota archaeon]|nr:DUF5652 family protein [Nanoarchaeota archaeon]